MALYGWFFFVGVAGILLIGALLMVPSDRAHTKRRLEIIQKRIEKKEAEPGNSKPEKESQ